MHRVEDHMQRRVIELRADAPLRCAIETMLFQRSVHGCVLEDGRLIGILSDHDVRRALPSPLTGFGWAEYELALGTITVGQAMTRCPTTVTPATPMREAVYMMLERSIRALPVVSHDRVVGILTDEICMAA